MNDGSRFFCSSVSKISYETKNLWIENKQSMIALAKDIINIKLVQ